MSTRIEVIDFIRGVALLGLPTMNIIGFSMPAAAYLNPTAFGSGDFANHFLYAFFHIFADQKFMGLFSMLFGASMLLFIDAVKQKQGSTAKAHYARTGILLLIGILHMTFLWEGDVLLVYASIGLVLYLFRNSSIKLLAILSMVLLALSMYLSSFDNLTSAKIGESSRQFIEYFYAPEQPQIEREIQHFHQSYGAMNASTLWPEQSDELASIEGEMVLLAMLGAAIFRAMSMMMLGMVLYKLGFIQGSLPPMTYHKTIKIGFIFGLPIICAGLLWNYSQAWSLDSFFHYGMLPNIVGGYMLSVAYAAALILLFKSNLATWFKSGVVSIGKMALTNYLMQSVICVSIFYGYGLGWFGEVTRLQLVPIILFIWIAQFIFSKIWLMHFTQGPIEWVWRCLTYFKLYPIRQHRE